MCIYVDVGVWVCVTVHLYGGQRATCGINSLLPLSESQGFKLRLLGLVVDMVDAATHWAISTVEAFTHWAMSMVDAFIRWVILLAPANSFCFLCGFFCCHCLFLCLFFEAGSHYVSRTDVGNLLCRPSWQQTRRGLPAFDSWVVMYHVYTFDSDLQSFLKMIGVSLVWRLLFTFLRETVIQRGHLDVTNTFAYSSFTIFL